MREENNDLMVLEEGGEAGVVQCLLQEQCTAKL